MNRILKATLNLACDIEEAKIKHALDKEPSHNIDGALRSMDYKPIGGASYCNGDFIVFIKEQSFDKLAYVTYPIYHLSPEELVEAMRKAIAERPKS